MGELKVTEIKLQDASTPIAQEQKEKTQVSLFEIKDKTLNEKVKSGFYKQVITTKSCWDDMKFIIPNLKEYASENPKEGSKKEMELILEAYEKSGKLDTLFKAGFKKRIKSDFYNSYILDSARVLQSIIENKDIKLLKASYKAIEEGKVDKIVLTHRDNTFTGVGETPLEEAFKSKNLSIIKATIECYEKTGMLKTGLKNSNILNTSITSKNSKILDFAINTYTKTGTLQKTFEEEDKHSSSLSYAIKTGDIKTIDLMFETYEQNGTLKHLIDEKKAKDILLSAIETNKPEIIDKVIDKLKENEIFKKGLLFNPTHLLSKSLRLNDEAFEKTLNLYKETGTLKKALLAENIDKMNIMQFAIHRGNYKKSQTLIKEYDKLGLLKEALFNKDAYGLNSIDRAKQDKAFEPEKLELVNEYLNKYLDSQDLSKDELIKVLKEEVK